MAIPREPLDFLARAVEAGHPRNIALSLPSDLQHVMEWNRDAPSYEIYKHRIEFVKFWMQRADELKGDNRFMLDAVPSHLRAILSGKRLAVWQEMIDYYGYPDRQLVRDITNGFPLTGWLPDSQVFPKDFRPPSMDVGTLQSLSKGMNAHVKKKVLAAADSELAGATWEETERELQEGWMEIDPSSGEGSSWAMRFGLQQKEKVRVIDDFSGAGVNQTAGLHERLKIFGIDDIAALIAHSLDSVGSAQHPQLLGKTMDLRSAYKQFGICPEDRERIRVATTRPSSAELVLLLVNALPFGATGSVSAFLRISMFLWYVGVIGLKLAWTSFYDDYTLLSRTDCASNTAWAAECLFDLLGVLFAKEGKKATKFDTTFNALGVTFDLKSVCDGAVSIGHTDARRSELLETLQAILQEETASSKTLERLRGRLLWFENFVCGRQANFLVAKLGKYVSGDKIARRLTLELKHVLQELLKRIESGKPVVISKKVLSTWICFTDGACEETCSVGGVLISPMGKAVLMFGEVVPPQFAERFYVESKHPIYEIELLPLLISIVM
eukprot:s1981_g18.t1